MQDCSMPSKYVSCEETAPVPCDAHRNVTNSPNCSETKIAAALQSLSDLRECLQERLGARSTRLPIHKPSQRSRTRAIRRKSLTGGRQHVKSRCVAIPDGLVTPAIFSDLSNQSAGDLLSTTCSTIPPAIFAPISKPRTALPPPGVPPFVLRTRWQHPKNRLPYS